MFHRDRSTRRNCHFFSIVLILVFSLTAAPSAFAADAEEADPDPNQPTCEGFGTIDDVLTLSAPDDLDTSRLAPGRYLVRIVDDEGTTVAVYTIVVGQ